MSRGFRPTWQGWSDADQHYGIDYTPGAGTPVHAVGDGWIRYNGYEGPYGQHVVLRHENGWHSIYGHLIADSNLAAGRDTWVPRGTYLGRVGNTGRSYGAHLHMEMRTSYPAYPGPCIDPAPYIQDAPLAGTDDDGGGIRFVDISGHAFESHITWLANEGVTRGWRIAPNTYEFRPQQSITRAEMAAFLYRLSGEPTYTAPASSRFVDVSASDTFYKEINWLADSGITTGWITPDGAAFRPGRPTARDVMAAFLYRYVGSPSFTPGLSPFRDVASSSVFVKEILWLASAGISTGWRISNDCYEYRPFRNVLRGEMAAFLYRLQNGGTQPISSSGCRQET